MKRLTIRPQHQDDHMALQQLYLETRRQTFHWEPLDTFNLHDFEAAIEGERVLVALNDDQIVGFISLWEPDNFVHNLFVDAAYQGQGIGQSLLHEAFNYIDTPARLKCKTRNKKAIRFYKKLGWQAITKAVDVPDPYILFELQ